MHIAVLTDGISPYVIGGMQRHSFALVKHLLLEGVKITLVHSVDSSQQVPTEEEVKELIGIGAENLRVVGFQFPSMGKIPGHYLRESYAYSCQIYEELKDEWGSFDFIYAKGFTAWCLLEKKLKGIHMAPIGVKFHGYEMYQRAKTIKERLEQFMLKPPVVFNNRNANLIFSYGGRVSDIIEKIGVDPKRIVEITGGIDNTWVVPEPSLSQGCRKFVFVGRNESRKGIDELKRAVDAFADMSAEFHWVGSIPIKDQLSNTNCTYHGQIQDQERLKEVLDNSDVLILPSRSEGMPNVILEAMARGCAILATDVGAVSKMVSKDNGLLISPDVAHIKKGIEYFLNLDETSLHDMKLNSREKVVENFLWTEIAKQTISEIERFTNSTRSQLVAN